MGPGLDFDTFVFIAYLAAVIALLVTLAQARLYRRFPAFAAFLFFELALGLVMYAVLHWWPQQYRNISAVSLLAEATLELTVLFELGRSVAGFNGIRLPHPLLIILVFGLATIPLWALGQWPAPAGSPLPLVIVLRSQQITSLLRVAALLTLAFWTSVRGCRWPEREFRIVSGIAFYSIVTFAVTVIKNWFPVTAYWSLSRISVAAYLVALLYWMVSFSILRNTAEAAESAPAKR